MADSNISIFNHGVIMRTYFAHVDGDGVVIDIKTETTDDDGVVLFVSSENEDNLIEISKVQAVEISRKLRFDFSKVVVVDGVAVVSDNQASLDLYELENIRSGLMVELETLEIHTARGFLWLVKHLIQEGVVQQADIPAKLIQYKARIEEIEAELNT